MSSDTISLTREELYEKAWAEPLSLLAPKLGLSDVGLAKICRKMRVPTPERGYWARKKAGQKVTRSSLPKLSAADAKLKSVTIRVWTTSEADVLSTDSSAAAVQERFETADANRIVVADRIDLPHPLIAQSILALRRGKPDAHGVLQPKGDCLDVQVTLDSSDRAMCILDALIKALDERNYPTSIEKRGDSVVTNVRVIDEAIGISLTEQVNRVEVKDEKRRYSAWTFPQHDWVATGKLSLRIHGWSSGARQSWSDGKRQRLENCLNQFIVGLVVAAQAARAWRLEREEREREFRSAEERRLLELQRREDEAARVRALLHAADQWQTACSVRRYVMQVRELLEGQHDISLDLREWLKWAEDFADRIDPLIPEPSVPVDPRPADRSSYTY